MWLSIKIISVQSSLLQKPASLLLWWPHDEEVVDGRMWSGKGVIQPLCAYVHHSKNGSGNDAVHGSAKRESIDSCLLLVFAPRWKGCHVSPRSGCQGALGLPKTEKSYFWTKKHIGFRPDGWTGLRHRNKMRSSSLNLRVQHPNIDKREKERAREVVCTLFIQ